MHNSGVLHDALIFLLAAVVIVPVFHRLRTSPILGYLVAGMLIGPYSYGFIADTKSVHLLAEFGVVFLLFMIGLELSLDRLRAMGRYVFGLGLLQVLITMFVIGAIAWSIGVDLKVAAIIGGGLGLSSTAFVLKLLEERGERASNFGFLSFAILLLQDIAVVPLLIMVTTFSQEGASFLSALGMAFLEAAVALAIVAWVGKLILRPVFKLVSASRSSELFIAVTLLTVIGTGWILSLTGLSMALGAFLAGLLLSETEYKHQVEADIRPFRGLLLGLFFMTIGMSINVGLIFSNLLLVAALVVSLLIGKTVIIALLCRLFGASAGNSIKTGLALSQGGEFGFVLFGAAGALNLMPADMVQLLLAVIALSMVTTPSLVHLGSRISSALGKDGSETAAAFDGELKARTGHVLIAGFGRVGQTVAKMVSDGGVPYVAIDLHHERVSECRAKGMPVFYGNASQVSVLKAAGAEQAAAIVITLDQNKLVDRIVTQLRQNYPEAPIFVRARDMKHLRKLETRGATAIVPETAEASLQLGAIVMKALDVGSDQLSSIIENYRENDYTLLEDIVDGSQQK